jgi:DNA mismatch repair protein MutL
MDAQLILVDQHAAHERVIYDGLTARRRVGGGLVTQQLLIPQNLELTPEEAQLMRSILPGLVELGLEVEEFGLRSFIVRSVPAILAKMSPAELLTNALNEVAAAGSAGGVFESLWQRVLASIACKGAIKAGQALSSHEAQALLEAWSLTDSPWTCPHGRPVGLAFGIEEISKRFLRGGVK